MRHFWGTTPARRLSGTTTPHATTSTSSVRQHTSMAGTAPLTRHYTPYEALHPLRGSAPVTGQCTRSEGVSCLRIGCSAPNHKNKRGICETTADTHKAPGARAPGALSIQRPPANIQQSAIHRQHSAIASQHSTIGDPSPAFSDHQSPISSQQSLHNHQSTISRHSTSRRRGHPRR